MAQFVVLTRPVRTTKERGFTLVEIMIVVSIIALLAIMALPSFLRARQRSRDTKFINAMRVATSAFETYAIEHAGAYPPDVGPGVLPAGMDTYFGPTLDWTAGTPIGGQWDWDYRVYAFKAGVSVLDPDASFTEMSAIDKMFDDGSLSSGQFQSIGATRYMDIVE